MFSVFVVQLTLNPHKYLTTVSLGGDEAAPRPRGAFRDQLLSHAAGLCDSLPWGVGAHLKGHKSKQIPGRLGAFFPLLKAR